MRTIEAVDIGVAKIAAGAVTENGAILSRLECPTAPMEGFAAAIEGTKEMLREAGRRGSIRMLPFLGQVQTLTGVWGVGKLPCEAPPIERAQWCGSDHDEGDRSC